MRDEMVRLILPKSGMILYVLNNARCSKLRLEAEEIEIRRD